MSQGRVCSHGIESTSLRIPVFFVGRPDKSLEELRDNANNLVFDPSASLDVGSDFSQVTFRLRRGGSHFDVIHPFFTCGLAGILVCEVSCPGSGHFSCFVGQPDCQRRAGNSAAFRTRGSKCASRVGIPPARPGPPPALPPFKPRPVERLTKAPPSPPEDWNRRPYLLRGRALPRTQRRLQKLRLAPLVLRQGNTREAPADLKNRKPRLRLLLKHSRPQLRPSRRRKLCLLLKRNRPRMNSAVKRRSDASCATFRARAPAESGSCARLLLLRAQPPEIAAPPVKTPEAEPTRRRRPPKLLRLPRRRRHPFSTSFSLSSAKAERRCRRPT